MSDFPRPQLSAAASGTSDRHPLTYLIDNLELRSRLSDADRRRILTLPYDLHARPPASYLLRDGEEPMRCGVLVSGFAYRVKLTGEGERQILAILVPGDAVDFQSLFLDRADHSVQMLTHGEVAFVPRTELQTLARTNEGIGQAIMTKVLAEASIFREWTLNVGRRDARRALAHLLCEIAVRLGHIGLAKPDRFQLPLTQADLADALGLTPVHVNRTLMSLEADGLINRRIRMISFPDWQRLCEFAEFEPDYLHLGRQERSVTFEGAEFLTRL